VTPTGDPSRPGPAGERVDGLLHPFPGEAPPVQLLEREDSVHVVVESGEVEGRPRRARDPNAADPRHPSVRHRVSPDPETRSRPTVRADAQFRDRLAGCGDPVEGSRRPPGEHRAGVEAEVGDRQGLEGELGAGGEPQFVGDLDEVAFPPPPGDVGDLAAQSSSGENGVTYLRAGAGHARDDAERPSSFGLRPRPSGASLWRGGGLWKSPDAPVAATPHPAGCAGSLTCAGRMVPSASAPPGQASILAAQDGGAA